MMHLIRHSDERNREIVKAVEGKKGCLSIASRVPQSKQISSYFRITIMPLYSTYVHVVSYGHSSLFVLRTFNISSLINLDNGFTHSILSLFPRWLLQIIINKPNNSLSF